MNPDDFIQTAIEKGQRSGVDKLDPFQRAIYLVSELEVSCDVDGIDSFVDRYAAADLRAAAELLRSVGAATLADGLVQIADTLPHPDDALLTRVNELVCNRAGYGYDSLARAVADHLASAGEEATNAYRRDAEELAKAKARVEEANARAEEKAIEGFIEYARRVEGEDE